MIAWRHCRNSRSFGVVARDAGAAGVARIEGAGICLCIRRGILGVLAHAHVITCGARSWRTNPCGDRHHCHADPMTNLSSPSWSPVLSRQSVAGFEACTEVRKTRSLSWTTERLRVLRCRWRVAWSVIGLRNAVVSRMKLELERRLSPPSLEAAIDRSRTRSRSGGGACHTQESRVLRNDHSLRGSTNTRA